MFDPAIKGMATALAAAPGVEAVVLGGSRARGDEGPASDYDLGLYFHSQSPFLVQDLVRAISPFVDPGSGTSLTPIGEWGPRIVGGGWLTVGGMPVDLLYRCVEDVEATIDDAWHGIVQVDYQPGHPHGFVSTIWLAEIHHCKPIFDASGSIDKLKQRLDPYPRALGLALVEQFEWEIAFAAGNAAKAIGRNDRSYIAGSIFRALACMAQVICAMNGTYVMNEKGAMRLAASLPVTPAELADRIEMIWNGFASGDHEGSLCILNRLAHEVAQLVEAWRSKD